MVGHVYDTAPTKLDLFIQNLVFGLRTPFLNKVVIYITHLADTKNIIFMCLVLLFLPTRRKYGVPVSIASAVSCGIYTPMKHIMLRARPDKALRLISQGGYSFPSGHAAISIAFFGLLFILVRKYVKDDETRNTLSIVLGVLSIGIGLTRIYVGVHWPTDVICGWCVGGIVVLITMMIVDKVNSRR